MKSKWVWFINERNETDFWRCRSSSSILQDDIFHIASSATGQRSSDLIVPLHRANMDGMNFWKTTLMGVLNLFIIVVPEDISFRSQHTHHRQFCIATVIFWPWGAHPLQTAPRQWCARTTTSGAVEVGAAKKRPSAT
jgi:hypothetical protein